MNISSTHELIPRPTALERIAAHLDAQDHYLITSPPDTVGRLMQNLEDIPSWMAYVDNGSPTVLRTERPGAVRLASRILAVATVIVVAKTVPRRDLMAAIDQPEGAPAQDVFVLTTPGGPTWWPVLFADALALVDPEAAAELRREGRAQ
ncbi:hypothetical protein [Streptomyces erythrochromogenes]|uniref:hypothetical protein n=1 Tax=Streptomyces erythrochromogenes TaxID=285574 RepID=UPI00386C7FA3|nr:hypothetical protein OG364_17465 [Streptomyces erythrochromogenes]